MKLLVLSALFFSFNSLAASKECSGEMVVAGFTCNTLNSPDLRLYINEYQTCENGKIVEMDRSALGMTVINDDIHTIGEEDMAIDYSDKRILIDPKNRVDFLSFIMPTKAVIKDEDRNIVMTITEETEPDYEGSETSHFKGSYVMVTETGKVEKGPLACFVYR